jgi:acyl carrier protein
MSAPPRAPAGRGAQAAGTPRHRRQELLAALVALLQERLDEEGGPGARVATATSPLIGAAAELTSLGLVSLVLDVESWLLERFGAQLTLVSDQALARRTSPFRDLEALVDYILELLGPAAAEPS